MDLHLVGGFLGSGKTTAILEAARLLIDRGKRVGIITNEQGKHLVDTSYLRARGLPALEVTGGCICCQLNDFADRIDEITVKFEPQVLFAESVGSCTDLVATVIKPLVDYRKTSAQPASLSVFTDSRLFLRYLRDQELPFSDSVIYIFEKQIEETNLLIANKSDLLTEADAHDLLFLAAEKYPHKLVRLQNSLDASQVADWLNLIQSKSQSLPTSSLDIDYSTYADGEGRFTWLDREFQVSFSDKNQASDLAEGLKEIVLGLTSKNIHIAHVKILIKDDRENQKISLTSLDDFASKLESQLDNIKHFKGDKLDILINVMVEGDQFVVETALDTIINQISKDNIFTVNKVAEYSRVPDKPKPTLRIGN
jgi:G3E family GTPase